MKKTATLRGRLGDRRSGKLIFLSHCLLNENTRYLGGACRGGCVREVVEECMDHDLGIVQMPCPEQLAWGGVTKPLILMGYGTKGTLQDHLRPILLPLFVLYTRFMYRRLARRIAAQIDNYVAGGFSVAAIVGVDGSPSCGVGEALDVRRAWELLADTHVASMTTPQMNAIVRLSIQPGRGFFIAALRRALARRRIDVPFLAYDLIGELDGKRSTLNLSTAIDAGPRTPALEAK